MKRTSAHKFDVRTPPCNCPISMGMHVSLLSDASAHTCKENVLLDCTNNEI